MTDAEKQAMQMNSFLREAKEHIIPELSRLFAKRRWEVGSVHVALEYFLQDLRKQFPSVGETNADSHEV